jgi:hypothetical protein
MMIEVDLFVQKETTIKTTMMNWTKGRAALLPSERTNSDDEHRQYNSMQYEAPVAS